jgi:hypothetical protein
MNKKNIAFCIPLMNRDADLKMTLVRNVGVIKKFEGRAKIYVNIYSDNNHLLDWVYNNFNNEINSNLLNVKVLPLLRHWHFSWAKNSFKNEIEEDYYSSLDGDNFLDVETVESLFNIIDNNKEVLFHGFSGTWGDGTSGQITMPTRMYKKYGYLDSIYPRQYDENGLISRALYGEEELVYASYENVDITNKSGAFRKAKEFVTINNPRYQIKKVLKSSPLNPRGDGYVQKDKKLSYYQCFNEAYTYLSCLEDESSKKYHHEKLFSALELLDYSILPSVLRTTFIYDFELTTTNELTLFSVIKNDDVFISEWLKHYRKLGVKRFIIVDDHSDEDLSKKINDDDVFILKPLVGDFKTCKVYWLKLLMLAFQSEDSWVLTVDSDEFLSIDTVAADLNKYIQKLEHVHKNIAPSILLDMLPNASFDLDSFQHKNFLSEFDHFYLRPAKEQPAYSEHNSVKWGFGRFSEYSYRLDSRWRFFNTFDSLRKIPMFKYKSIVQLNQGFHTIAFGEKAINPIVAFSDPEIVVPLKHYKFVSYFIKNENKTLAYSHFVNEFTTTKFNSIFFKRIGAYRIIGNDIDGLHSNNQTYENLEFILKNEKKLFDVDKYFVLNRISSRSKLEKYKALLAKYDVKVLIIDFDIEYYNSIPLDNTSAPSSFKAKTDWDKLCVEVSKRESRNCYAINNNGARNFALTHGKSRHQWTFPWDGNCFLTEEMMTKIRRTIDNSDCTYLVNPMERLLDNQQVLDCPYPVNSQEEPQLCFRQDSKEKFNDKYFYGFQPKVELLKRLGVPGMWDKWLKIYPWKACNVTSKVEAKEHAFSSSVYRLSSGNVNASKNSTMRSHNRTNGIIDYLDYLSNDFTKT